MPWVVDWSAVRILTRRIYRAFPELDGYSDEQCARFLRAARRGFWRQVFYAIVVFLVFAVILGMGARLAAYLTEHFGTSQRLRGLPDAWFGVLNVLVCVPFVAAAPVAAFLARDLLLRRRVRRVLRRDGLCPMCRYSLVGLPLDAGDGVVCPECGLRTQVDRSLGELVLDEQGRAHYQPGPELLGPVRRLLTPRRKRWLKRVGVGVALLVFVGGPLAFGGYEGFLRRQAATARRERVGADAILDLVKSARPPDADPLGPNAWEVFSLAMTLQEATDARVWRASPPPTSHGQEIYPDFSAILAPPDEAAGDSDASFRATCERLARLLIEQYRADGVFSALDEISSRRLAMRPVNLVPNRPLIDTLWGPEPGSARGFARVNGARMRLANAGGDLREYVTALESGLALSRVLYSQPFLGDALAGIAVEGVMLAHVRETLETHPDADWLGAIQGAIDRQYASPSAAHFLQGERLLAQDMAAWVFSSPGRVRFGRFTPELGVLLNYDAASLEGVPWIRLGTYAGNKRAFTRLLDQVAAEVAKPGWARGEESLFDPWESNYILARSAFRDFGWLLRPLDQIELERRSVTIMFALERFRNDTGAYSSSLADLTPRYLKNLPIDPCSGKPFLYRRVDPAADPQGRGYLLYLAGGDGRDDGGRNPKRGIGNRYRLLRDPPVTDAIGFDFIINDRYR